jgi:7-carboxy-7-deazaguanine synthase
MTLTITEIYASIQGESTLAGFPCTFVRLTGCPLRCRWCDTAHAFSGGQVMELSEIVGQVRLLSPKMVEITGGEPLAQEGTIQLLRKLVDCDFKVLLETSGSQSIAAVPKEVHIVMDLKCPGSKMENHNLYSNIRHLKSSDDIKFVIADHGDFLWANQMINSMDMASTANILYSCAFGLLKERDLAQWMLEESLPYRLQLQQHKYIWNPRSRGV